MPPTVIRGTQVLDGSIQRADLDVVTVGKAVVAKLVQGSGIILTSTGADSGTGDVTVASSGGSVDPGTWTNLTYSTGWTQNTTAQFRVEVNGAFSQVICQGIINYANGAAPTAFTLPVGARPAVARSCSLAGFDSTGDVLLFCANVSTAGVVTITPVARQAFSWPSATNGSVYLDNLVFSL